MLKINYKNLFFDLDNTLWDFKTNAEQTLKELLSELTPEADQMQFLKQYYLINKHLWLQYRNGDISKEFLRETRFKLAFEAIGLQYSSSFIHNISESYLHESPLKSAVFAGTYEILEYLKTKGYRLFLITNGFIEVQIKKIKHSKLDPYFERMITSDEAGYQKPNKKIFEFALKSSNSKKNESLMIGDDQDTDIVGAINYGMDCIWFNPNRETPRTKPDYTIQHLLEIKKLL